MLLSVPWTPNTFTNLRLPSQPHGITTQSQKLPEYVPIKMRRKVFLVNDRLAVGVAGQVMLIRPFLKEMKRTFANREEFACADVMNVLDKHESREMGAILLLKAKDWSGSLIHTDSETIDTKRFGKVISIGTGAQNIISQVQELDKYEYGLSQPSDGDTEFPEFPMLCQNLMLLANIYWREFLSPDNIFESWGSAYDLIYENSDRAFQYLTEYTIFFGDMI